MSRDETDRRIEAALSLFIVSVWIGLVGEVVGALGQARTFWAIRNGSSHLETTLLWTWVIGLRYASSCGFVYGLWQIAGALVGGRLRLLAISAFRLTAATIVVGLIWQPLWGWVVLSLEHHAIDGSMQIGSILIYGLAALKTVLFVATVVAVARSTPHGKERRWAVRGAAAIVFSLAEMWGSAAIWASFFDRPLIAGALGAVLALLDAVVFLVLLTPARRVFRSAIDSIEAPDAGPYRTAQKPIGSWKTAPELAAAGRGLVEMRRRLGQIGLLSAIAVPFFILAQTVRFQGLMLGGTVVGAVQLVVAARLLRGLAAYARLPHEARGRPLALAGLACLMGGWLLSLSTLVLGAFAFTSDAMSAPWLANVVPGNVLGGAVGSMVGTVLVIGSLARAAGGLGDKEVRRRAWIAIGLCVGGFCAGVGGAFIVAISTMWGGDSGLSGLLVVVGLAAGIAFLFVFRWLLAGAARMLGEPV